MRLISAVFIILCLATPSRAEDPVGAKLSAPELTNTWRTCDVSGLDRAAKVRCINKQAEKIERGKDIQDGNQKAEALTRAQVGVSDEDKN